MTIAVDSSNIDKALVDLLNGDASLNALLPDGTFMDEAPPGAKRFVIVSVLDARDIPRFGGRAYEDTLYLIKAVGLSMLNPNMKAAAFRLDQLLDDQVLTVTGYTPMTLHREERVRLTEVDDIDSTIRWYHRGGRYRVMQAIPQV
jgi:hypothetical protein